MDEEEEEEKKYILRDSTQGLFKEAIRIVENKLGDDDPRTWTATSFASMWMQRMSVSLQRGNAQAILYRAVRDR